MVSDTLPKLLRENYAKYGNSKVALRKKDRGIWKSYTWEDYFLCVKYLSLGLVSLGMKKGDKISILGENSPEWYFLELAAQSAGGIAVGIFTDCTASEVKYYAEHSDSRFAGAHDQEQVDKFLQIRAELPLLTKIIYWEDKGLWSYNDPMLISFNELIEIGKSIAEQNNDLFDDNVAKGIKEDIAVICYTSGTTGLPKGALLDHNWLVEVMGRWSDFDGWKNKGYEYVSFIPPAWATEQGIGIAGSLLAGLTVNFPEEPETVPGDMREISPQLLFYGARYWENINRMVQTRIQDATFFKRLTYRACMQVGYKWSVIKNTSLSLNFLLWKILNGLAYLALFRPLTDKLGLKRIKIVYSAGGALSPDIIRFFQAIGIDIRLYYGSTEIGITSSPRIGEIRPETSGKVLPWVKVRISDDGEILVKNPFMYRGYYKNDKASREKIDNGWFKTGDFGYLDENEHLIVIDRMDDLKELAGGQKFSPQFLEIRLRFSPYIRDAVVIGGDDKKFVSALINIDLDNVGKWAENSRIAYTTFTDLSQKLEVLDLIKKEIKKINTILPDHSRIKKFVNMYKEFDPDEAEMTRTRKLRRSFVEKRFDELIAACYGNKEQIKVSTPVTYQDGRKGYLQSIVRVAKVENR